MTEEVHEDTSKLDPWFYFKQGYSGYLTYVLGAIELGNTTFLNIVLVFHIPISWAIILFMFAIPILAYSTYRIGIWDYLRGGKRVQTRLHYKNDEPWSAVMGAIEILLRDDVTPEERKVYAKKYMSVMIRYGINRPISGESS